MKLFSTIVVFLLSTLTESAKVDESDIPEGTYPKHSTTKLETKVGNEGEYTFPEDSSWRMFDFASKRLAFSGSVTCTCTSGTGCNPDEAGNCYMIGCNTCTKKTSGIAIRHDKSVKFLENEKGVERNLPSTDARLFEIDMIQDGLKQFKKKYGKDLIFEDDYCPQSKETGVCEARDGHAFVAVDVFGSTTYVPAEIDKLGRFRGRNLRAVAAMAFASLSCSCNVGNSCPMDSTWGHKYCNAGDCTSCTMSGTSIAIRQEEEFVKPSKGRFP